MPAGLVVCQENLGALSWGSIERELALELPLAEAAIVQLLGGHVQALLPSPLPSQSYPGEWSHVQYPMSESPRRPPQQGPCLCK